MCFSSLGWIWLFGIRIDGATWLSVWSSHYNTIADNKELLACKKTKTKNGQTSKRKIVYWDHNDSIKQASSTSWQIYLYNASDVLCSVSVDEIKNKKIKKKQWFTIQGQKKIVVSLMWWQCLFWNIVLFQNWIINETSLGFIVLYIICKTWLGVIAPSVISMTCHTK